MGAVVCAVTAAFISTTAVAGIETGSFKLGLRAGLIVAATAVAFFEVGEFTGHQPQFGTPAYALNVTAHAAVGCASAVASGGKCGPSALAGGITSAAGPVINGHGFFFGLVANTTLGGGAAVLGGGKFENGAITSAFGYLFNAMAECERQRNCMGAEINRGADHNIGIASSAAAATWFGAQFDVLKIWFGGVLESIGFTDYPGNKSPFTGDPNSTVRGGTQSRTYGGYPVTERDLGHPDEAGIGCGDHCQDWGRPSDGGPPTNADRGPPRLRQPGDPPVPRGPNVPPP